MRRLTLPVTLTLLLFSVGSCSKKDSAPTEPPSTVDYTVAFSVYSSQPKSLFLYTDIKGAHIDTLNSYTDSFTTVVPSGADMQVLQKVECLDTSLPDEVTIHAYMNGSSVSNSKTKLGTGPLVVGVELQSLL